MTLASTAAMSRDGSAPGCGYPFVSYATGLTARLKCVMPTALTRRQIACQGTVQSGQSAEAGTRRSMWASTTRCAIISLGVRAMKRG